MHNLKCTQPYFDDIWNGYKRIDIRINDRNYKIGDYMLQKEYNENDNSFSGRIIKCQIYLIRKFPLSFPKEMQDNYVMLYFIAISKCEPLTK